MTRRTLSYMMALLCLLAMLLILPATWAMPLNELHRWNMQHEFDMVPHPPDSVLVASVSEFGILDGAGNHCNFLVGAWRRSTASGDALRVFYQNEAVRLFHPDEPESEQNYAPDVVRMGDKWNGPGMWLVYRYDGPRSPHGDFRCW